MAAVKVLAAVATDAGWKNRVTYYCVKAAIAVFAEDAGTASHAARINLAKKILQGDQSLFAMYSLAVLTNASIASSSDPISTTDGDMEYAVNSMFTAFALSEA
jgi:hypothetical protein